MPATARVALRADQPSHLIPRHLYGQFAEHLGSLIYGGLWVGQDSPIPNTRGIRDDVVDALKQLSIPDLRWPGGCFADEYHWRDGIGPRDKRPKRVNTVWGGVVETNAFGTHEFLDLCDQVGCEAYLAGNLGSGSVHEMRDWVEYLTYAGDSDLAAERRKNGRDAPWKIAFWGVGNENWGCGGGMRPEFYADEYRRYAEFCRGYHGPLFKVACGPNGDDLNWTKVMMDRAGDRMDGLSLHYYTVDWKDKGSATQYDAAGWFKTLSLAAKMDGILARHSAAMDERDPEKKVALVVDEWGTWHDAEPGTNGAFLYQQNTVRDALVAGTTLNIFHKHAERARMANVAQMVNVLQAMILTDGPRMLLTPTYHVFELYKPFQDATHLAADVTGPHYVVDGPELEQLSASACRSKGGAICVALCNRHHDEPLDVEIDLGGAAASAAKGRVVMGDSITAHNTFDRPDAVKPVDLDGLKLAGGTLTATLPARSVAVIEVR